MSENARESKDRRGALYGIAAAILFEMSAPISKLLLPQVGFFILASLLYSVPASDSQSPVPFGAIRVNRSCA